VWQHRHHFGHPPPPHHPSHQGRHPAGNAVDPRRRLHRRREVMMFAPRECSYCGQPLPLSKPTGRPSKFCPGSKCRVAAHRGKLVKPSFVTPAATETPVPDPGHTRAPATRPSSEGFGADFKGYVSVYFEDECPSIGSGWRRLVVLSLGWKWARMIEPTLGTRARIARPIFDRCRPRDLVPGRDYSVAKLTKRLRRSGGRS
jgi:hypothetical protein